MFLDFDCEKHSSSIFDNSHSNDLSVSPSETNEHARLQIGICQDKQKPDKEIVFIVLDNDSGIEIDDLPIENIQERNTLKNLIPKLDVNTELLHVQPNLSTRLCTTALSYPNLPETHIIMVNIECISVLFQQKYLSFSSID